MSEPVGCPAVFLDRDGTLVEERGYPVRAEDLVPLPGAGAALGRLGEAGYLRLVLTNQSVVARGRIDEEGLGRLHAGLSRRLQAQGGTWDELYYCPHHPEGLAVAYAYPCACRKPAPGLALLACHEHGVDLSRSCFVGDGTRDLFPGLGSSLRILVRTGHPLADLRAADHVAEDIGAAVDWLLARPLRARGA